MKKILLVLLMLLMALPAYGADTKVSAMTEATSPNSNADLLYIVVNPGASPASRKMTMANFLKLFSYTKTATGNLSAAEVSGTQINNYGQTDDMTLTLPTAAAGYNFIFVVSTTVAKYIRLDVQATDQIYFNGTGLGDGKYVGTAAATIGSVLSCFTFQTGSSAYDWICKSSGAGTWASE